MLGVEIGAIGGLVRLVMQIWLRSSDEGNKSS